MCLLLSVFAGKALDCVAQNDPQSSMYWAVPTLYNPAAVGCDSALHVVATDRMQWVGVKNAPRTFTVSLDAPFKFRNVRNGAGVIVMNDKAGLFNTTQVGLQYAYSRDLVFGRLALGLQGGFINQSFSANDIYIPDGDAWESNIEGLESEALSGMALDLAFGAYYETPYGYAGLGVQHLSESSIELGEIAYTEQKRSYYFTLGGNILIKRSLLVLQPFLFVKTTLQALQFDYTLRAVYDRKFWGGMTIRPKDAVVLMVGADIGTVRLGYSYDIGVSPLAKASSGSHELLVTYSYKIDLDKQRQRAKKSIRIL